MNKKSNMDFDPQDILVQTGKGPDDEIDLVKSALALAASDHEGVSVGRYLNHIKKMSDDVQVYHRQLLADGAADDGGTKLAALKHVLADVNEYTGDIQTYDDIQNADLFRVIDRRKGLPIALSILYVEAGQAQGWDVRALSFPGHVLCRIEDQDGERLIFDPFEDARVMSAPEMRALVKMVIGPQAELSAAFYETAGKREMLVRLQNNIKLRQIENSDYKNALKTVKSMQLIDPSEYRLLLDAGVLYARLEQKRAAIEMLGLYIEQAPDPEERAEAQAMLVQLQETLQ